MEIINAGVTVKTNVLFEELKYNGAIVLKYKIEYPEFSSRLYRLAVSAVNRFYKSKALEYQSYCRGTLFKEAVKQYKYDVANGFPVRMFEAMTVFEMTYAKACVISLLSVHLITRNIFSNR